jgi:hypothetical protein
MSVTGILRSLTFNERFGRSLARRDSTIFRAFGGRFSVTRLAIFSVINDCVLSYIVSLPTTRFRFACRHSMSTVVSALQGNARGRYKRFLTLLYGG